MIGTLYQHHLPVNHSMQALFGLFRVYVPVPYMKITTRLMSAILGYDPVIPTRVTLRPRGVALALVYNNPCLQVMIK